MAKEARKGSRRSLARGLRRALAAVVLLLVLLPLLAFGLLQTGWGQRQALAIANDALAPSGLSLRAEGISGLVPFDLTVALLRLDDRQGPAIEAENLHLSISAGDLLAGEVNVGALRADRLAVNRVPETPPAAEAASAAEPEWPALPVDLSIDRIDLDRLELGAAFAGEEMALSVNGSFALADSAGTVTLTVQQLDAQPARLALTAAVDPIANTLELDLVAEEREGSILPTLVGWDYQGAWRLALHGDGPLGAWQGTLVAAAGDETLADLAFAGALDLAEPHLSVAGTVTPPAGLLPPWIAPEPITVDLAGGLTDEAATIEGTLDGRGLDLALDVAASLSGAIVVDGTIEASTPALDRVLAGLELPISGDARVRVTARGPLTELNGSVSLSSGQFEAYGWQASDLALAATFTGAPVEPAGDIQLTLAMRAPRGPDVDLGRYRVDAVALQARATAPMGGGPVTISDISLAAGPTSLSGTVSLDPAGGPIGFDLAVATDAGLAAAEADLADVAGRLVADLAGAFDPDAGLGWIEATVDGEQLDFGDPALDGLVGPTPNVRASGQLDTAYGLQGMMAQVTLPGARADVAGDLPFAPTEGTAAPIDFAVEIDSLAALAGPLGMAAEELAGSVSLVGSVADPFSETPQAAIEVQGDQVVVAGQSLGAVTTTLGAAPTGDGRVAATIDAALESDYGPVHSVLEALYDPATDRLALQTVDIDASGARLTGALDIDLATLAMDGTLSLSAARLATLAGLIGVELGGSATARIALSHSAGRQDAQVSLNARSLAVPDAVDVDDLTVDASVSDLLGDPRFNGTARATTVATSVVSLDDASLDATGSLAAIDLTLRATGESAYLEEPFPLAVDAGASISPGPDGLTVRLASLAADFGEEQLALAQPLTVRSVGAAMEVTGLDATVLGGRIAGDIRLSPAAVDVGLEVTDVALDRSAVLTGGIGMSAKVDRLGLHFTGSGAQPSGTIALEISGVQIEGDPEALGTLANAKLQVTGDVQDGMLSLDARLGDVTERPITLTVSNAMLLSLSPFAAVLDHGQPIDGRLQAETELADLNPIVAPSGEILLAGLADIDIAVGGVGGAPVLSGEGTISNASIEVIEAGLVLVDINARIAGEGSRLTIRSLSARDPRGGGVAASGWVDFGGDPAVDINANLNQLLAFNTDYAEAVVTGALTFDGPLASPAISGEVTVRPAEIRFAEISTAGYVEVDAIDVNGAGQIPPEESELVAPIALPLDVLVRIPNAFYVRGYGLESEWAGEVQVAGTTAAPTLVGEIQALRGTMDLAGQAIEIGRGIVTFTGASPPDPLVDIEAVAVTEDVSVSLTVSGPASSTDFKLESVPPLPQEEIMNRLLFGTGRGGVSGNQAFQAGRALALITGREGDLGLVNTLRSITGITGLTVETAVDEQGLPAARVGGYVTEDVLLSVTRGTATGSGEAGISVEVLDGIDLESSVTETGDSRVGVNFEWDY